MNNQVLIIGSSDADMKMFPEVTDENSVVEGHIGLVQLRTSQQANLFLKKLEGIPNIKACSVSKFYKMLSTEDREYVPLHKLEPREFVDFQFSCREQLLVLNDNNFSVLEIQSRGFESIHEFPTSSKFTTSGDGVFICFYNKNEVEIRAGGQLRIFNRILLREEIERIAFSPCNRYMVISTRGGVEVWDVFKSETVLHQRGKQANLVFEADLVHFPDVNKTFSLSSGTEVKSNKDKCVKKMERHMNQTVEFIEDGVQRIQHTIDGFITSKTHANIEKIEFYFSGRRCFVLTTRNIKKDMVCFLESYSKDGITMTQLPGVIEQVHVSDDFFVVVDSEGGVSFYKRDRFGFSKVKRIMKEDDVLAALYDNLCCVYDSGSDNIEFYDGGELRSVYSHQYCNSIRWSHSGLYVCSMSAGDGSSGLVQMFDRNGKLLWKKIFNNLSTCIWRPFVHISDEEKAKALEGFDESAIRTTEDEDTVDSSELLSRWKSYLLSKKQEVLARK